MHDILLIVGAALLTFAIIKLFGGTNGVKEASFQLALLIHRLEYINMALPDILAVVTDLEAGVAGLNTEVQALLASVAAGAGGISAADADALQARLEGMRTAIAAIPALP